VAGDPLKEKMNTVVSPPKIITDSFLNGATSQNRASGRGMRLRLESNN